MTTPLMTFEEVRATLKQRFPMLMVDTVISLEPGKSIRTTKNVTGNEIQFLGHFPELRCHARNSDCRGNRPIGFHSVHKDDGNRNAAGRIPCAGLHQ